MFKVIKQAESGNAVLSLFEDNEVWLVVDLVVKHRWSCFDAAQALTIFNSVSTTRGMQHVPSI